MPSERFMRKHYGASGFVPKKVTVDSDEHITTLIAPLVRDVYGDEAELGHYKIAIAAFKLGRRRIDDQDAAAIRAVD